ncbi:KTSC domain-containing protein [Phytoactinopolyspora halotolerans]|uniref:KTSC domain-containing protein n=1 Tax=Phytoactinopolyspora halotolerans TaxID=1981512 RepID=A0A6L9S4I1_9ACTN|nr:KTSC domain-containing protein [Phytoactinopolyspora halotolerans]NED99998.1 KTSC domain-containing protein [Phytoactinopolyspora halotolerans]
MRRQRVSSKAIASVGFDGATNILEVEYRSGAVYRYFQVPRSEVDGLLSADSMGRYVNTRIKPRYSYVCIQAS